MNKSNAAAANPSHRQQQTELRFPGDLCGKPGLRALGIARAATHLTTHGCAEARKALLRTSTLAAILLGWSALPTLAGESHAETADMETLLRSTLDWELTIDVVIPHRLKEPTTGRNDVPITRPNRIQGVLALDPDRRPIVTGTVHFASGATAELEAEVESEGLVGTLLFPCGSSFEIEARLSEPGIRGRIQGRGCGVRKEPAVGLLSSEDLLFGRVRLEASTSTASSELPAP